MKEESCSHFSEKFGKPRLYERTREEEKLNHAIFVASSSRFLLEWQKKLLSRVDWYPCVLTLSSLLFAFGRKNRCGSGDMLGWGGWSGFKEFGLGNVGLGFY